MFQNHEKDFGYKKAEISTIKNDIMTRRLSLMAYDDLKLDAARGHGEYLEALAGLSDKNTDELIYIINQTNGEVKLAHELTGIK